jgi:hypothetical protein
MMLPSAPRNPVQAHYANIQVEQNAQRDLAGAQQAQRAQQGAAYNDWKASYAGMTGAEKTAADHGIQSYYKEPGKLNGVAATDADLAGAREYAMRQYWNSIQKPTAPLPQQAAFNDARTARTYGVSLPDYQRIQQSNVNVRDENRRENKMVDAESSAMKTGMHPSQMRYSEPARAAEIRSEATKYGADQRLEATKYSSDKRAESYVERAKMAADTSLSLADRKAALQAMLQDLENEGRKGVETLKQDRQDDRSNKDRESREKMGRERNDTLKDINDPLKIRPPASNQPPATQPTAAMRRPMVPSYPVA